MIQTLECQSESCLESDDAERTSLEFLHFLCTGVRSMIGRDGVDCASYKPVCNRVHIARLTQRRLHFVVAVVGGHVSVSEHKVVGGCFRGHFQSAPLRECHHLDRDMRRNMRDVVMTASKLSQNQVPRYHHVFGAARYAAQAEPR